MGRVQAKTRTKVVHRVWPPRGRGDLSKRSFTGVLEAECRGGGSEWERKGGGSEYRLSLTLE